MDRKRETKGLRRDIDEGMRREMHKGLRDEVTGKRDRVDRA